MSFIYHLVFTDLAFPVQVSLSPTTSMPSFLPAFLSAFLPVCLPAFLPAFLPSFLPAFLPSLPPFLKQKNQYSFYMELKGSLITWKRNKANYFINFPFSIWRWLYTDYPCFKFKEFTKIVWFLYAGRFYQKYRNIMRYFRKVACKNWYG